VGTKAVLVSITLQVLVHIWWN